MKEKLTLDQQQVELDRLGLEEQPDNFNNLFTYLARMAEEADLKWLKKMVEMLSATHYRVVPGGIILYREN